MAENKLVESFTPKKRTHTTPKRVKSSSKVLAYIISVANKAKIK
jgi:hypothetical protein